MKKLLIILPFFIFFAACATQPKSAPAVAMEPQPEAAIAPAQPEPATDLAASYVVKLNPKKRDCLWRIAGFDYIYSNPLKWTVIYEKNKSSFKRPNDPNLIVPGQVLQIPSINGEVRSGQR